MYLVIYSRLRLPVYMFRINLLSVIKWRGCEFGVCTFQFSVYIRVVFITVVRVRDCLTMSATVPPARPATSATALEELIIASAASFDHTITRETIPNLAAGMDALLKLLLIEFYDAMRSVDEHELWYSSVAAAMEWSLLYVVEHPSGPHSYRVFYTGFYQLYTTASEQPNGQELLEEEREQAASEEATSAEAPAVRDQCSRKRARGASLAGREKDELGLLGVLYE
jgi:hypothetical protein